MTYISTHIAHTCAKSAFKHCVDYGPRHFDHLNMGIENTHKYFFLKLIQYCTCLVKFNKI